MKICLLKFEVRIGPTVLFNSDFKLKPRIHILFWLREWRTGNFDTHAELKPAGHFNASELSPCHENCNLIV
jgi:hypothetical protein